jgi:PKD repeat protein
MKKLSLILLIMVVSFAQSYAQQCQAYFTYTSSDPIFNFTDQSTGSALFYQWDFGDGNNDYSANTSHTYTSNGMYLVCLTIYDSLSACQDTYCDTLVVSNASSGNCSSNFIAYPDTVGCGVYFSDQSVGSNLNYWWDFGDGNTSSSSNPFHSYATSGTYTVCLTIWDNANCADTICLPVTVNCSSSGNCTADYSFVTDSVGCGVYFTNLSTGGNLNYFWDFGDGNNSSSTNPYHSYATSGSYLTCLTVWDNQGCSDTICNWVTVQCSSSGNCTANFGFYTDSVNTCNVYFNNLSTGGGNYYWDFGDGNWSSSANPSNTYANSGAYTVCLTVWDNQGCADTLCQVVQVQCNSSGNCSASFIAYPDTACGVWFSNQSTGSGLFYQWDFGDGNLDYTANPYHNYGQSGQYYVCLTIYDSLQACQDTYCQYVSVTCGNNGNCLSNFGFYPDSSGTCTMYFYDLSTGGGNYYWDFGDGNWSSTANPTHTYGASGTYTVCLTIWDNANCADTLCLPVTINCNSNSIDEEVAAFETGNIYPNPANGVVNLQLKAITSTQIVVSVYNTMGQVIREEKMTVRTGENRLNINVEGLSKGAYMLNIRDIEGIHNTMTKTFMKL